MTDSLIPSIVGAEPSLPCPNCGRSLERGGSSWMSYYSCRECNELFLP
ncbi:MAG: hypothetical protein JWP66_395 [Naasia sp.]|nr:hypothetical protein [Naasia sp.]